MAPSAINPRVQYSSPHLPSPCPRSLAVRETIFAPFDFLEFPCLAFKKVEPDLGRIEELSGMAPKLLQGFFRSIPFRYRKKPVHSILATKSEERLKMGEMRLNQ